MQTDTLEIRGGEGAPGINDKQRRTGPTSQCYQVMAFMETVRSQGLFSREVPGTFIQAWMYKEKALELQDHVTHIGTQVLKLSFPSHLSTFPMN